MEELGQLNIEKYAEVKRCPTCKRTKSRSCFNLSKNRNDGLNWQCRSCQRYHSKKIYRQSKKKILIRTRKYYQDHKESQREHHRRWALRHKKEYIDYRKKFQKSALGVYRVLVANQKKRNGIDRPIISKEGFVRWYSKQKRVCIYCHIPESKLKKNPKFAFISPNRLTIDRKNNSKGYISGNLVLACGHCNFIKSDILSFDDMIRIGRFYKKHWLLGG